jgi:hypothetical protein
VLNPTAVRREPPASCPFRRWTTRRLLQSAAVHRFQGASTRARGMDERKSSSDPRQMGARRKRQGVVPTRVSGRSVHDWERTHGILGGRCRRRREIVHQGLERVRRTRHRSRSRLPRGGLGRRVFTGRARPRDVCGEGGRAREVPSLHRGLWGFVVEPLEFIDAGENVVAVVAMRGSGKGGGCSARYHGGLRASPLVLVSTNHLRLSPNCLALSSHVCATSDRSSRTAAVVMEASCRQLASFTHVHAGKDARTGG